MGLENTGHILGLSQEWSKELGVFLFSLKS